jgi:hypothetical protein
MSSIDLMKPQARICRTDVTVTPIGHFRSRVPGPNPVGMTAYCQGLESLVVGQARIGVRYGRQDVLAVSGLLLDF